LATADYVMKKHAQVGIVCIKTSAKTF